MPVMICNVAPNRHTRDTGNEKKEMIKIQSHQWQVNFMLIDINKKALVENSFSIVLTL